MIHVIKHYIQILLNKYFHSKLSHLKFLILKKNKFTVKYKPFQNTIYILIFSNVLSKHVSKNQIINELLIITSKLNSLNQNSKLNVLTKIFLN